MASHTTTMPMPGCAVASGSRSIRPEPDSQRPAFERFVDMFYRRRQVRAAFESCVAATGYVDHAVEGSSSRSAAIAALCHKVSPEHAAIEVLHTAFDRDVGMVHLLVGDGSGAPRRRRVDIFRLSQGRIVEHWEVVA